MPKWILVRQEPNQNPEEYGWNEATQRKFKLDKEDVAFLEAGSVMWDGEIAYTLEEVEEVGT